MPALNERVGALSPLASLARNTRQLGIECHLRTFSGQQFCAGTLMGPDFVPLPGAVETVGGLSEAGKEIYTFSDSGTYARDLLARRIVQDFPHIKNEKIITSQGLIPHYLRSIGFKKKIYAIGELNGLIRELRSAGFQVLHDDEVRKISLSELFDLSLDPEVGAVVLGMDLNFSYLKLVKALNYLKDESVLFLAAHKSLVGHFQPIVQPVVGALSAIMEAVSGREATYFGKNSSYFVDYLQRLGCDMSSCLYIGDSQNSGVLCGQKCGMDTLLVLSGLTSLPEQGITDQIPHTYYASSLQDLLLIFKEVN